MLALSCESREAVDKLNELATTKGGTADINPVQDLGFIYKRTDLDGHVWEMMWMNLEAMSG